MNILISLFLSFYVITANPLWAMDTEICKQSDVCADPFIFDEVPLDAKSTVAAEKARFDSYKLDDPEAFLAKIRKQFGFENPEKYVEKLQAFAVALLGQNLSLQKIAVPLYISNCLMLTEKSEEEELKKGSAQKIKRLRGTTYLPKNLSEQAAQEMMQYVSFLKRTKIEDQDYTEAIFPMLMSDQLEVRTFARSLKFNDFYAKNFALYEIKDKEYDDFPEEVFFINSSILNGLRFAVENLRVGGQVDKIALQLLKDRTRLLEHSGGEKASGPILYTQEKQLLVLLISYKVMFPLYDKLYQLIRKELFTQVLELIKKEKEKENSERVEYFKQFLKPYALVLPILASFPPALHAFIAPSQQVKIFSKECEWEQFKKEHSVSKRKSESIKKKKAVKFPKTEHCILKKAAKNSQQEYEDTSDEPAVETETKEEPLAQPTVKEPRAKEPKASVIQRPVKIGVDGSYILPADITRSQITFHNPVNNTIETIYKTDRAYTIKELLRPSYTEYIKQWFTNPRQAIIDKGYSDPNNPKFTQPDEYWHPKALHTFARLIDDYIQDWGTRSNLPSRRRQGQMDVAITIPGMIEYPNGLIETGTFVYLIDPVNGQWFHRMFTPQKKSRMFEQLADQGYYSPQTSGYFAVDYDAAFPPLTRAP